MASIIGQPFTPLLYLREEPPRGRRVELCNCNVYRPLPAATVTATSGKRLFCFVAQTREGNRTKPNEMRGEKSGSTSPDPRPHPRILEHWDGPFRCRFRKCNVRIRKNYAKSRIVVRLNTKVRALPRGRRAPGYCSPSRRFHVQSFGHVFQVLIKLYDQSNYSIL